MKLTNITLNLNLPELSKSTSKSVDFSSKAIKAWLTALPTLDIEQTAEKLIAQLILANRLPATISQRQQFLNLLASAVYYVTSQYQGRYVNVNLPLAKTHQKQAILVHTLYTEMASGYKRMVQDAIHQGVSLLSMQAIIQAIHHAMYYLGQLLYVHYQTYTLSPARIWVDLYILYQYAELIKCLHKKIKPAIPELLKLPAPTIHDQFVRIVLLTVADPYHLSQAQQQQLDELLKNSAIKPLEFKPWHEEMPLQTRITVDLGQAKPPPHVIAPDKPTDWIRVLDYSHFTQQLDQLHEENLAHQVFSQQKTVSLATFLSRPLIYWQKSQQGDNLRHAVRMVNNRVVKVIIGLHDIYQYMSNHNQYHIHQDNSPESPIETAQPTVALESTDESPTWLTNHKTEELPQSRVSLILDESAKGCRLSWGCEDSALISVGRLVAVSKESDPTTSSLLIGRVRWLKQIGHQFQMGIEWLAPCLCHALLKSAKHRDQQALLLSSYPHYTLVTTANVFAAGDPLELVIQEDQAPIHLLTLLTSSELYAHFSYRTANTTTNATIAPPPVDELESLWKQL